MNASEVPADLKSIILAGMRVHETKSTAQASTASTAWWRTPWVGIAAALAVLLSLSMIPRGSESTPQIASTTTNEPALNAGILNFLADEISKIQMSSFELIDEDPEKLKAHLASHQAPTPSISGKATKDSRSIGCLTFNHNDVKVSIICFKGERVYHLMTANRNEFPMDVHAEPQYFEVDDQAFKLWTEGEMVQILSVKGNKQDIPELI